MSGTTRWALRPWPLSRVQSSDWHICRYSKVHPTGKVSLFSDFIDVTLVPRDTETDLGMPALGPNKDQLPQDLNVTFFFDYTRGTVETIEIINTTDGRKKGLKYSLQFSFYRSRPLTWCIYCNRQVQSWGIQNLSKLLRRGLAQCQRCGQELFLHRKQHTSGRHIHLLPLLWDSWQGHKHQDWRLPVDNLQGAA